MNTRLMSRALVVGGALSLVACGGGVNAVGQAPPSPPAVATTAPAAATTPPSVATTPPAAATTPPAVATTPPAVATTPPATATTPPAAATTPPAVATTPPAVATTPPAVMTASCIPSPAPSPVTTTVPFPITTGGIVTSPAYFDATGSQNYPANTEVAATMLTLKTGGSNYDTFQAPSAGGTTIFYAEASIDSMTPIAFTGSTITISATSPSCFTQGHAYYADVAALLAPGAVIPITNGIAATLTGPSTITFQVSTANMFPAAPTVVQVTINQK